MSHTPLFEYEPDKTLGKVRRQKLFIKTGDIIYEVFDTVSDLVASGDRRKFEVVAAVDIDYQRYLVCAKGGPGAGGKAGREVTLQYVQKYWDVEEEGQKTVEAKDLEPGMIVWVEKQSTVSKPAALVITQVSEDVLTPRNLHIEGEFVGFPNYKHVGTYDLTEEFVVARRKESK